MTRLPLDFNQPTPEAFFNHANRELDVLVEKYKGHPIARDTSRAFRYLARTAMGKELLYKSYTTGDTEPFLVFAQRFIDWAHDTMIKKGLTLGEILDAFEELQEKEAKR